MTLTTLATKTADWWGGLEKKAKAITAVIAVVVGIAAFPLWMETRYATASDLKAQAADFKTLYLQAERRAIQKELFEWEIQRKRRRLSDMEERRVRELQEDLKEIESQTKALQRQRK